MSNPKLVMQIEGVKETLAELNKFDKVYRRQVTKDIKGAGAPIIATARQLIGTRRRYRVWLAANLLKAARFIGLTEPLKLV
jgi:hypothetical protein